MLVDLDYRRLFLVSYINFPNVGPVMTFGFLWRISFRFYSFLLVRCTCEGVGMWSDNFPVFPLHFLLEALVETFSFFNCLSEFFFWFSVEKNEFLQESLQFCFISMLFLLLSFCEVVLILQLNYDALFSLIQFFFCDIIGTLHKSEKGIPIVIKAISYMTAVMFLSWISKQVHNEIYQKRSGNILLRNL